MFKLTFNAKKTFRHKDIIGIRFRNSGYRYEPFNIRFSKLYNSLCRIDPNYYQIQLEEYLDLKKNLD